MWDNTKAKFWNRIAASTGIPLEGLSFIYDACDFTHICRTNAQPDAELEHFTAADYCRCFVEMARTKLGSDYIAALHSWNLGTSEKLGQAFYRLIDLGLMGKQEGDSLSEFAGQFSFADDAKEQKPKPAYTYPLTGLPDYQLYQRTSITSRFIGGLAAIIGFMWVLGIALWVLSYIDPTLQIPVGIILAVLISTLARSHIKYPRQFSLRTLFLVMTIICIMLGLFVYLVR